ncbi:MAG: UDP-N-acetylmuramate dehydrogenase [Pirellulales bacterium]
MASFSGFEEILKADEPLAPRTWFGLGGPAQFFAEPRSAEQLQALVARAREEGVPVRMLGGGSNLLVRPEGVPGLVIQLADPAFSHIEVKGTEVVAGAGAKLGHVISTSIREGLGGLEALVGIPGTIGGALHGNAGSRGGDIGQWTCHATVMTVAGALVERKREDMVFAYRDSSLDELAIVEARFQLEQDDPVELTKRMQKQWIQKKAAQPLGHQSAGCIFKNPRGMSAGMLIDQAGLKGARVGGAEVSTRHANFIVAEAGCTTSDVLQLIEKVKTQVTARLGVDLELEIEIW